MTNEIIYIFSKDRYAKMLFYFLLKKQFHFIIISDCASINPQNHKVLHIHSLWSLMQFMCKIKPYKSLYKPEKLQTYSVCFIAVKCKSYSFKRLWIIEKKLRALIPNKYVLNQSIFIEKVKNTSNVINIYSLPAKIKYTHTVGLQLLPSGFGDVFRHAYIFQKFISMHLEKNKQVTFIHSNHSSFLLSKILFSNCINKEVNYKFSKKLLRQDNYNLFDIFCQVSDIDYLAKTRAYDISMFLLSYFYTDISTFYVNLSYTSNKSIRKISELRQKFKYVIGVQFNTSHDHPEYQRNYPEPLAQQFVSLCQENNIAIVNLTTGYHLPVNYNAGHDNILGIPGIIKLLDIVISIDSFSGHLAACMNKPSIILYNCIYSFSMSVLKNNYNLISSNNSENSIKPSVIYHTMITILEKRLLLPNTIKQKYDILNEKNTKIL